jgi:hypothetical protein
MVDDDCRASEYNSCEASYFGYEENRSAKRSADFLYTCLTESTASQLASNNELAASQFASTNNELDDPIVVARRNHPNWIAKRSKILRLSTYEFFFDNNYCADDEDDYLESDANDLLVQTIDVIPDLEEIELGNLLDTNKCDDTNCLDADANDDVIPDLEEIELGDLLDTEKCDDERKYLCEKCRSKYVFN